MSLLLLRLGLGLGSAVGGLLADALSASAFKSM